MLFARILFFALLLFYSSLILTSVSFVSGINPQVPKSLADIAGQDALIMKRQSAEDYQSQIKAILENYSQKDSSLTETNKLSKLESDLLAMKIPTEYKDLHLQLIQALYKYKDGKDDAVSQSRQLLEQAIKRYTWLSSNLSLFIINNFQ
jgi:hypothetical protein